MEYLIGAIVLGMFIWAGVEIVQTIRSWERNPSETNRKIQAEMLKEGYCGQFGGDAVESGSQTIGHAVHDSHCAASSAGEASPNAIAHVVEGLLHVVHH